LLFNSLEFGVFFLAVLLVYYRLPHRGQNLFLLLASYLFYGWWDWRFLSLIAMSTLVDYACARAMTHPRTGQHKGRWLAASIVFNLGVLAAFKYFDFFATSLRDMAGTVGLDLSPVMLSIILPVGISFYTFQTMSYSIDVYRGQLKPARRFLDFALFVSFFPQLVAGPIERATHLLPQITGPRPFELERFYRGGFLILWGLFKKVVIADNLAPVVDQAFADPGALDLWTATFAVYCFAWQIYCDFSGYTDIARGTAAMLGIDLRLNFNLPYFATNPSDFWKRWHISLSSWLRDYLYIPLGGNRLGTFKTYRNLMLTMVLGGLWHGAGWPFVLWGVFHGALLCGHKALSTTSVGRLMGRLPGAVKMLLFFHLVCVSWLLFRAESVGQLGEVLAALTRWPERIDVPAKPAALMLGLLIVQVIQYRKDDLLWLYERPWPVRAAAYTAMVAALFTVGQWGGAQFIYFQF